MRKPCPRAIDFSEFCASRSAESSESTKRTGLPTTAANVVGYDADIEPDADGSYLRVDIDLQDDFSMNQTLSLFLTPA